MGRNLFECIFKIIIWSSCPCMYTMILNILSWFQGTDSRLVQQSLWPPLCRRSCADPQLLSATNHRRPRDQNLKLFARCVCSALTSRLSLWVTANRQTRSIDPRTKAQFIPFLFFQSRNALILNSSVPAQSQRGHLIGVEPNYSMGN